jgi:hypothetical protein
VNHILQIVMLNFGFICDLFFSSLRKLGFAFVTEGYLILTDYNKLKVQQLWES